MKLFKEFFFGCVGVVLILFAGDCIDTVRGWTGWQWLGGWICSLLLGAVGMFCIRRS